MRRLIHLSDLHFGRDRPELLEPLLDAVNGLEPDLVALSGDLTQRARPEQFEKARQFIDALKAPSLVVPGNHDVPLDNPFLRIFKPWGRYKRHIDRNLEPEFRDDEIAVIGVNTVNPLSWQRGRMASRAVARVRRAFSGPDVGKTRVVVAHHPFEHLPGEHKKLMHGAKRAIDALAECGADIVLTGHLHAWRADPFARREGRAGVLQVHAGTGLSTRLRGEENDFNLLTLGQDEITVQRYVALEGETRFTEGKKASFRSSGSTGWGSWQPEPS